MTRERKTLRKIYTPTYKNNYWAIKTEQGIYNTVIFPYGATDGLACCKTGWYKASKEGAGTQTRRMKKKKGIPN
jgi:hypothetical protein